MREYRKSRADVGNIQLSGGISVVLYYNDNTIMITIIIIIIIVVFLHPLNSRYCH